MTPHRRIGTPSILLVLVSLTLCLLMIGTLGLAPLKSPTLLFDQIKSTGHFFCFGVLAFLAALAVSLLWPTERHPRWLPLVIGFVASVLAGGLLELVQKLAPPRSSSWGDLFLDGLGALAGVCLLRGMGVPGTSRPAVRGTRWRSLLLMLAATSIACAPLVHCWIDYLRRNAAYPMLIEFQASWTQRFCKVDESVQLVSTTPPPAWPAEAGDNVAQLRIGTGRRFPGWSLKEPYPRWPAEADLVFEVLVSSPEQLQLILRVHDAQHNEDYYDRFNGTLQLVPGFQQVRIPVQQIRDGPRSRQLDLSKIRGLKLFAADTTVPTEFTLGNLRLE